MNMLPLIKHTDRHSRSTQYKVIHFSSSGGIISQPVEGKTGPPELISESGLQIPRTENCIHLILQAFLFCQHTQACVCTYT